VLSDGGVEVTVVRLEDALRLGLVAVVEEGEREDDSVLDADEDEAAGLLGGLAQLGHGVRVRLRQLPVEVGGEGLNGLGDGGGSHDVLLGGSGGEELFRPHDSSMPDMVVERKFKIGLF
jgi:hypothetical protein